MRSVCSQLTSSSLRCGRFLNGLCGMSNVLSNSGGEETVFGCRFSPHDGGDEWSLAGPGFSIAWRHQKPLNVKNSVNPPHRAP